MTKPDIEQTITTALTLPRKLTSSVNSAPKQSKLLSSLVNTLENGREAYENKDYVLARFCFESAVQLAKELEQREWSNVKEKEEFTTQTIPAIITVRDSIDDCKQVVKH